MKAQILIPDQLKSPMGGMGEQARNLFSSFPDANYHFDIIGSPNCEQYTDGNISFYPIDDFVVASGKSDPIAKTLLSQSLFVQKGMTLRKPDIIHAFDWSTFWAGMILSKHYDVPLVVTIQLSIAKMNDKIHPLQIENHSVASAIECQGLFSADKVIQVSENYASLFPHISKDKTTIIHNGVNLKEFEKFNKIELPGNRKYKLIYIGRYADMKNVDSLLKAEIPEDIDLIFIGSTRGGDTDIFDRMQTACKERDNLHYVGAKYGQEKVDYLCNADAVIVPSKHEPFGIVALEALASKSILLSSFVNGMGDFLHEACAINCGTTPESISLALKKFTNLNQETKNFFIENGLEVCKKHQWGELAKKLCGVYDEVLS